MPITEMMRELFHEARELGNDSNFVFFSPKNPEKPFSNAENAYKNVLGASGVDHFTLQDMRRTVATQMGELGIQWIVTQK